MKYNLWQKFILDSISHVVRKFQKDWSVNKKKAKFGDGPLKQYI